jgi:hypothetical protein
VFDPLVEEPPPVTRAALGRALPVVAPVPMTLLPRRIWSGEQWRRIGLGHESRDMDDKWDVFVEGFVVFLHRSWTGYGIYEATFAPDDHGGWRIVAAVLESEASRYRRTSPEFDRVLLELILCGIAGVDDIADVRANFTEITARTRGSRRLRG